MSLLDALPVWATALLVFGALVLCCEAGARVHRGRGDDDVSEEGYLVSAALGLLALLLGFTFSLALDRYETRRNLVVVEANALGTAWLRADLLPDAPRAAIRDSLAAYADTRLAMAAAGEDRVRVAATEVRTARYQQVSWRLAVGAAGQLEDAPYGAALLASLNDVYDATSARHAALRTRIPGEVALVLGLYALIAAGILGYTTARGRLRHRAATTALLGLLAMTIGLIVDLDRPRSGAITVDQSPMEDVRATMRAG